MSSMLGDAHARDISVRMLSNGTRTVVLHDPLARNCTVALAVGAGMRHEQHGEEGMMHLLEHVIYQDSEQVSAVDRQHEIERSGSTLGGHTHMDYSEYYETGDIDHLVVMLERLNDQVFAPAFEPAQVIAQIHGVAQERTQRLAAAPGGILPWPHLTRRYWADWANGHDGTGDLGLLDRATPQKLRQLHQRYYRRANTVISVHTSAPPEHVHDEIERIAGSPDTHTVPNPLPISRGTPAPGGRESPDPTGKPARRRIHVAQLADAHEPTEALIGDQIAASVLRGQRGIDASAGLFGLGDLVHDDLFVVVDDTGLAIGTQDRFLALPTIDERALHHAIRAAIFGAEKAIHDDERATRTVARDLLLRESAAFSVELVSRISALTREPDRAHDLLDRSSRRLASHHFTSAVIETQEKTK